MNNGKICISVYAETTEKLIEQIKRAEELANVIEIRFDYLNKEELNKALDEIPVMGCKKPFLLTFRSGDEGGFRQISEKDKMMFWESINENRPDFGEFVDCEWRFLSQSGLGWNFYDNVVNSKIICSYHNFQNPIRDFKNLNTIFEEMLKVRAAAGQSEKQPNRQPDIFKIAVKTEEITDSIAIWQLLKTAKTGDKQFIPIAMGEGGKWTRILGLAHGAFLTYAALNAGHETAPGQVSAKDLIEVYRAGELDEKTDVYGILANPVAHSVSPEIQNAAFKFHQLNAVYIPFEVKNLDEFIVRMVKPETREIDLNFKGFSVTIPHKQKIIKHLDFIDDTAKTIGAVNTVKIVDGKLHGYNTDAAGFIGPLKQSYGDLKNANVAILGAGGSARACVYALKQEGANITIFARDLQKAKALAEEFGINYDDLSIINQTPDIPGFDILVNTTPLGMKGKFEGQTPVTANQIKNIKLVYDLVFNPLETQLMKEADKANIPKIGGMAMLVAQGAIQQKIWTGLEAPVKEMNEALLKKLA